MGGEPEGSDMGLKDDCIPLGGLFVPILNRFTSMAGTLGVGKYCPSELLIGFVIPKKGGM